MSLKFRAWHTQTLNHFRQKFLSSRRCNHGLQLQLAATLEQVSDLWERMGQEVEFSVQFIT